MGDAWDPQLYLKFKRYRDEPFRELLGLLHGPFHDARVVDLGCGDGHLTAQLHEFLKPRSTLGVDSSAAMLAEAPQHEGLEFVQGDMRDHLRPGTWDIIFSHAALQWVDDQIPLFENLYEALRPGGQLAVQMPANHDIAIHEVAREVAARPHFAEALGGYNRQLPVFPPEVYAMLLARRGVTEQKVSLRVFMHRLENAPQLAEWARGTFLTPYRERLGGEAFERFYHDYCQALAVRVAVEQPQSVDGGSVWLPFKRILLWARKPEIIA